MQPLPVLAMAVFLLACGPAERTADCDPPETAAAPAQLPMDAPDGLAAALGQPVHLEGHRLVLLIDGAEVRVTYLAGDLRPVGGGGVVDTESPASFEVRIDALEVVIPEQTIQTAMAGAPFDELTVRTDGDSLVLHGRGGPLGLPFDFRGDPHVSPHGTLVVELEKVGVLGIGVKGFIGTFQKAIENAANKRGHLLYVDKDQLRLDPFPLGGPPEVHAHFTSVVVREHELVARLGEPSAVESGGDGSLVLRGGVFRSGKQVLFDNTVSLVSSGGGDLVIDPARMTEQIEQGFMKQAHDGSISVHLVDPSQLVNP